MTSIRIDAIRARRLREGRVEERPAHALLKWLQGEAFSAEVEKKERMEKREGERTPFPQKKQRKKKKKKKKWYLSLSLIPRRPISQSEKSP